MSLISFTTDRRQGHARAAGALHRILKSHRLPTSAATAEQVHGARILCVPRLRRPQKFQGADGLVTGAADQPLAIFTADCVPLFLSAQNGQVIGLLHAGWRGVRSGLLENAVRLVRSKWRCRLNQIKVWPGPAIGPCCFEVQWDVARFFPLSRRKKQDRGSAAQVWRVDLVRELREQARRLGLAWVRQAPTDLCTMHHRLFYSYRRDRTENRQVSVIIRTKDL